MNALNAVSPHRAQALRADPPAGDTITIEVTSHSFELPPDLKVKPGTRLEFVNKSMAPHSVTSNQKTPDGKPLFDVFLSPLGRASLTVDETMVGEQGFFCKFHPGMTGKVEVLPKEPPPADKTVEIRGMQFPEPFEIEAGKTVEFVNADRAPHTVTSKAVNPETGEPLFRIMLPPGASVRHTFGEALIGEQEFTCDFHPMMKGKVTVTAPPPPPAPAPTCSTAPWSSGRAADAFVDVRVNRSMPRLM